MFYCARLVASLLCAWAIAITLPATAGAATLTGAVNGSPVSAQSPDGLHAAWLTVVPVTPIGNPNQDELLWLQTGYSQYGYSFVDGASATGTFNVLQYGAFALNTLGGANFTVLYNDGSKVPQTDYSWIQIGYPTFWGNFGSMPFVDSSFSNTPFYDSYTPSKLPTDLTPTSFYTEGNSIWLNTNGDYPQQHIQNPAGGGSVPAGDLLLVDTPLCSYTCPPAGETASITFDTYLVTFSGSAITFHDGFSWGVAVDEPPTVLLLALGFGVLAVMHGRRFLQPS